MRIAVVAALVASTLAVPPTPVFAQGRFRHDRYDDRDRDRDRRWDRDADRDDYRERDLSRYDRRGRPYRPNRLGRHDRIFRGRDSRYYCRRDDGTTGLVVGGVIGSVLGGILAPGDSKTIGALLGAGVGAAVGREIDEGIECR